MIDTYWRSIAVERCVDGDTIDVVIDLGFRMSAIHRVRLLGLNTPEKKNETMQAGRDAQAWVENWLLTHAHSLPKFFMRTEKADAFNRYLATIECCDGHSLNDELLASGHAVVWEKRR